MAAKWAEADNAPPSPLELFSTVGPKDVHVSGSAPSPPTGWPLGLSLARDSSRGDIRELQYELRAHGSYVGENHALTFAATKQNVGTITHTYNLST